MKGQDRTKCPVCEGGNFNSKRRLAKYKLEAGVCLDCTLAYVTTFSRGNENEVGNSISTITSAEFYKGIIGSYESQSSLAINKAPLIRDRWATIIGRMPNSILEIGCGTGQYYEAWKKLGVDWQGVEVNKQMLGFCRSRGMPVLEFDECITSGKKYDVIFLSQVLEHILEPRDFLKAIGALLAGGGVIHVDVPNQNSLTSMLRRLNIFSNEYGFIQPMHHLIAYTNKSLAYLLEHSGYEVVHMSPYPNNDKIFGQLGFDNSLRHRIQYWASTITRRGSLLVCMARRTID